MATYTLTATAQTATTPPSVRLVVGVSGTGQPSKVTVQRIDADGITRPVRTPYGSTLPISGGTGLVYDYEYPYGTSVTYTLAEAPTVTAAFTMTVTSPWLTHVGLPSRSVPLTLRMGSNSDEDWTIEQGVYPILGSSQPIIINGGARQAPSSSLLVEVGTVAAQVALRQLLSDGAPLLLNVPTGLGLGIGTSYISVGAVKAVRQSTVGTDTPRDVQVPYQVVGRPGGPTQAPVTGAMVAAKYGSWSAIPAGKTWNQLADPTSY